jgi:signal transduction histidine kinase
MEPTGLLLPELQRHLDRQARAQEHQIARVRMVMVGLAAVFVIAFRQRLPGFTLLLGLLAVMALYNVAIPWLLRRFPAREVGIVTTGLDMAAVTVAVYVASEAIDAYLFYGLVILGTALRFGMGASVWSAIVVSGMYLAVVLAGAPADSTVRDLLPIRIFYLIAFGVVAGLFSRVVIARATENARLQLRLEGDERERARVRERELLSALGRDFGASLEREATVAAIAAGAAPLLGDATLLYLLEPGEGRLRPVIAGGPDADLVERWRAYADERVPRLGEGIAGSAAATATSLSGSLGSALSEGTGDPDGLRALGLGWVLAVPILSGGRVLGVLATAGRPPATGPDPDGRRLAEGIAERAGPALENAALWADLQERVALEQQAQRVKDDFLSIVSHELRTPLTSIQGYAQLLEGRLRSEGPAESKEMAHLRVIRSQAGRMRRLVDDLLDVSRIDRRGSVSIEPADFDLAETLRETVARARGEHPDRDIGLVVPDVLPVRADRDRLEQVVVNLLENAVKYSPDGGSILVQADALRTAVQVRVADAGVGIPPEQRNQVFERFYQAEAGGGSRRRFGGLGLGLYISRAIVDAHGGRIWASPNEAAGRGTIFSFRIPRHVAAHPSAELPTGDEPPPFVLRRRDGSS